MLVITWQACTEGKQRSVSVARAVVRAVSVRLKAMRHETTRSTCRAKAAAPVFSCNGSEAHPLVARRKKSRQKPPWPLFFCARWIVLFFFCLPRVLSEGSSSVCTTCAFLQVSVVSSFCSCGTWICSVCPPSSETSLFQHGFISDFGLCLNYWL